MASLDEDAKEVVVPDKLRDVGWSEFCGPALKAYLDGLEKEPEVILELGVFLGSTTRFLLKHTRTSQVVSADLFDAKWLLDNPVYARARLGGVIADLTPETDMLAITRALVPAKDRARSLVMRSDSVAAMSYLTTASLYDKPDLIVLDADNTYEGVKRDLSEALRLWPKVPIIGMLFQKAGVRKAAVEVAHDAGRAVYIEEAKTVDQCYTYGLQPAGIHTVRVSFPEIRRLSPEAAFMSAITYDRPERLTQAVVDSLPSLKLRKPPLHMAAQNGATRCICRLLRHDPSLLETRDAAYGNTPLLQAAYHGKQEAVLTLLRKGAAVLARNTAGENIMDVAHAGGYHVLGDLLAASFDASRKSRASACK